MKAYVNDMLEKEKTNAFLNVIINYFEGEDEICKLFEF